MITTEDKRQWAAEEAVRLRECVDLIECGEMVGEPLISRDAEIVEAIAQDYGRPRHVIAPTASRPTLLILIGATMFSLVFRGFGGDDLVQHALSGLPGGAAGAVLVVMLTVFLLGFVMDAFEIIIVIVPIVAVPTNCKRQFCASRAASTRVTERTSSRSASAICSALMVRPGKRRI